MKDRKNAILSAIINEHVSNEGLAVSSKAIVDKYDLLLSPATIRNEMAELEEKGFIYQPHTSAGRVPTEKGWQYYIENYLDETVPDEKRMTLIEKALHKKEVTNKRVQVKNVAKELADMSKNAVFVGFDTDDVYYTGIANLFGNPEFNDISLMYHMSEIIDHLDDVVEELFNEVTDSPRILIGSENPFGKECSTIFGAYQMKDETPAIFGILGPMRMDYEANFALINFTKKLFTEE